MIAKILRWFGYVSIDYGFACGRHWIEVDGKMIAQTHGDDFWMKDNDIRRLAQAIIPECVWKSQAGDEWFIQEVKQRWPWHDLEAMLDAKDIRECTTLPYKDPIYADRHITFTFETDETHSDKRHPRTVRS